MASVSLSEVSAIQNPEWQSTVATIQEANAYLLATNTFADVIFIVGETEEAIPAHRLILMSRSTVFENIFLQPWDRPDETHKIYVPEVRVSAFNAFLKFLYTNDYTDVSVDAAQVLHLAHSYEVRVLAKICSNLLNETIRVGNALQIYKLAKEMQQLDLQDKASTFILKHAHDVFQQPDFYTTELELLCSFLQSDELNMYELEIFRAVMRWIENKCQIRNVEETAENKRSIGENAILLIRFPIMDPSEFTSEVVYKQNGVLSEQEVIQVYIYFNSKPESRAHLFPMIFNTNLRDGGQYKYGNRSHYGTGSQGVTIGGKLPAFAPPLPTGQTNQRKKSKKRWISGCV